jgi:uncharacterized protein YeaO (DUF488 family)
MQIRARRVYEAALDGDGFRVLVDRLWPRGLTKERAAVDLWAKEVAPSTELRQAFHRDGMAWDDFAAAYRAELDANAAAVAALRAMLSGHEVSTLLYSVHDAEHNHAVLLREALLG